MFSKSHKLLPNIYICLTPNVVKHFKRNKGLNNNDLNFDKVYVHVFILAGAENCQLSGYSTLFCRNQNQISV